MTLSGPETLLRVLSHPYIFFENVMLEYNQHQHIFLKEISKCY